MTKHPAKFSKNIIDILDSVVPEGGKVLDPFGGVGGIFKLDNGYREIYATEIEPEWALEGGCIVADAHNLPFKDDIFDAIVTSPVYGNRFSDHHNAKDGSRRRSYTHDLGRKLHPNNSGQLHWGPKYKQFHKKAWIESKRVLKPRGLFFLNISNHIKNDEEVDVISFHCEILFDLGFYFIEQIKIDTPRMRYGANNKKRVEYEMVEVFSNGAI